MFSFSTLAIAWLLVIGIGIVKRVANPGCFCRASAICLTHSMIEFLAWVVVAASSCTCFYYFERLYSHGFEMRISRQSRDRVIVDWADSFLKEYSRSKKGSDTEVAAIEAIPARVREALGGGSMRGVVYFHPGDVYPYLRVFVSVGFGELGLTACSKTSKLY